MIRRSTVVYLVLLLALVGVYYFVRNREQPAQAESTAEPTAQVSYLFSAEQGTPSALQIKSKSGATVDVARSADQTWVVHQPVEAQADQGAAEAAATQITTLRITDQVADIDPKIVGLDTPEYVLTVKFTSGTQEAVEIGSLTPSESGYYVRDASGKVLIVSRDGIDSLLGLLNNPPYLETPTPSPTTTETSTPTPASPLPEAGTPALETATP